MLFLLKSLTKASISIGVIELILLTNLVDAQLTLRLGAYLIVCLPSAIKIYCLVARQRER